MEASHGYERIAGVRVGDGANVTRSAMTVADGSEVYVGVSDGLGVSVGVAVDVTVSVAVFVGNGVSDGDGVTVGVVVGVAVGVTTASTERLPSKRPNDSAASTQPYVPFASNT